MQAGNSFTLFCGVDGTVWSSGKNGFGQLGLGDMVDRLEFEQIPELYDVEHISCSWCHVLCLDSNGDVWAWGNNSHGQLGLGDTENRHTPCKVPGLSNIKQLSTGGKHSLCVDQNGNIWVCGCNAEAQLALPDSYSKPDKILNFVQTAPNVNSIHAGYETSYFTTLDACYGVGYNMHGQHGTGAKVMLRIPKKISIENVKFARAGPYCLFLMDHEDNLWAMGKNEAGQLGIGESVETDSLRPSKVSMPSGINVVDVAAGSFHTLFLDSEGNCRVAGCNMDGQLGTGDGAKCNRVVPALIQTESKIVGISCGLHHSALIDENEILWMFGSNTSGQLGIGDRKPFYRKPVRVVGRSRAKSAKSCPN